MNIILYTTTFLALNLDFFVILLFLLKRFSIRNVIIGYILGIVLLMTVSFVIGKTLLIFLPEWILGVLGLGPIYLAFVDNDEDKKLERKHSEILTVFVYYIAVCSGCNLSLFIPILVNLSWLHFAELVVYFIVLTIVIVQIIKKIGNLKSVTKLIELHGETIMRVCYVAIGIYVLIDSGFVSHIINLIF